MCVRKPGRRCPSHASAALKSAQRRRTTAAATVKAAQAPDSKTPPSRVTQAKSRLAAAEQNLAHAREDMDATRRGRDALLTELSKDGLSKEKRARLSARFEHAEALNEARAEHVQAMPDLPAEHTREMSLAHTRLAETRDRMARVDAQLATSEDPTSAHRLRDQQSVLSEQVFTGDVQYRHAASGGRPDLDHVSREEQQAAQSNGPDAQHTLMLLSHQRAAAASGDHAPRFSRAVDAAGETFRTRFMPSAAARPATAPPTGRPSGVPRPRRSGRRRRRQVLTAEKARTMLRRARGEDTKVTPGKHQNSDPLSFLPEPV